jgi:hypothetical protein
MASDTYSESVRNAVRVLDPNMGDEPGELADDVATIMTWVREAMNHHDGDAYVATHVTLWLQRAMPLRAAEVMAAIMVDHIKTKDRMEDAESKVCRVEMWIDDDPGGYSDRYGVAELIGHEA